MSAIPDLHGTRSTYNNRRCRCPDCRAANAAYARERLRAAIPPPLPADEPEPVPEKPDDLYAALGTLPPVEKPDDLADVIG